MGRKSRQTGTKKSSNRDRSDLLTKDEFDSPLLAAAQSCNFDQGPMNSESDSELELLAAIGAPAELMREVRNDMQLRKKISQIIKSSEEETAAILKQQSAAETPAEEEPTTSSTSQTPTVPEVLKGPCAFCEKDAETRCTGCRKVFYCDKNCQKEHWKIHKETCRPFTISRNKEGDRILVASRDLVAEDFILAESPIVIGPRFNTEPICLGCYKNINGKYRCSKCTWPLCGSSCEENPNHKHECEITAKIGLKISIDSFEEQNPLYDIITLLRCLSVASKEPKRWRTTIEKFNTRYLHLMNSEQYLNNQEVVVSILRDNFRLNLAPSLDSSVNAIQTMFGILQTNHVPVKTLYAEVQALFPNASLAPHSCIPNTRLFWEETSRLRLMATEEIKKGEPITINYTDMLWGTRSRRDFLQQTRYINCSCRRCKDPTELSTYFSAFKCRKCPKPSAVLSKNPLDNMALWKCENCEFTINPTEVMQMNLALGGEVAEALSQPTIPVLEKLQKEWLPKVHTNHYHLHAVKHSLLQLYGRDQEKSENKTAQHWDEIAKKEKCCKEFLLVCSKLDPSMGYTIPYVGLTFYEYHKTIVQNAKRNYGLAQINEQQLKKRMLLSKALLKKAMDIFKDEAEDTPEGQLFNTCREEAVKIGSWMLAVGLV